MKLRNLLLVAALLAGTAAQAQISYGGSPVGFTAPERMAPAEFIEVVPENLEALKAEDEILDQHKDIPYRFGANIPVSITMNDGQWIEGAKGERLWQLAIESPGAVSINFNFSTFNIPEGAQVFVYDADRTHFIGAFTHKNMQPHGGLAVSLIQSDRIIIEYYEPAAVAGQGILEIDNITHGYRSVLHKFEEAARGPFGNSGSCNINVNCPEGAGWEDQIRSVAIIVVGGNGICTGSMVNNTAEDGTPYFLTANHCVGGGSVANWVFYFNHEAALCNGNTAPTTQSVSGAQLRASNAGSDFALLELNETPPEEYDVFYSGWDRTGNFPTSQTCIHHPGGDIKKITHDFDPATQSVNNGSQNWFISEWEEGTTEPGSSGSPLFDQNGRIIGQLFGGVASCSNNSYDFYGRFDVSWDGTSASTRLRDWLDPAGTNISVLDGLGGAPLLGNDASVMSVSGIESLMCSTSAISPSFTLRNNGAEPLTSVTIEATFNGDELEDIDWTGNLASGETENINLPEVVLQNGNNMLIISITNPNNVEDENPANNISITEFIAYLDAVEYEVYIVMDSYGSETSWEITDESGQVIHTGGNYAEPSPWGDDGTNGVAIQELICLADGCYTFTIFDEFGDGICCEYGNGGYTLFDSDGNPVATGGDFTNSESVEFCVTTVSIDEAKPLGSVTLFPNPAQTELTIQAKGDLQGVTTVVISDITGRIFKEEEVNNLNNRKYDVSDWAPGVYTLTIRNGEKTAVERFVISR